MNKNFFKKVRILDGGMGQELLARGIESKGTLWSASALLDENYHQLVLDTHLDFIDAGAEVIVTTTFSTRRMKLRENNIEEKFEYLNIKAGEIAQKAKMLNEGVFVAGGLPPQNFVYQADKNKEIEGSGAGKEKLNLKMTKKSLVEYGPKKIGKFSFFLLNMNHINETMMKTGADPINGIIGADFFKKTKAIISYKPLTLFLEA